MSYYSLINYNYDVIYFNSYIIASDQITLNQSAAIKFTPKNLRKFPPIAPGEAFYYKKHIFDKFSFNEKNSCTCDYEFNMALVTSNNKYLFYPINEVGVFWINRSNDNISSRYKKIQRYETIAIMFKYCRNFKDIRKVIMLNLKNIFKYNFNILKCYNNIK